MSLVLSLFDYTGAWSQPYWDVGHEVVCVDIKESIGPVDILTWDWRYLEEYDHVGILAAPPCTHFSGSGAQYWKAKDTDGRTDAGLALIDKTLEIVDWFDERGSLCWWVLENPVGRLPKLRPRLGKPWYFQPHWYGDPYTKKTGLWGKFNNDLPRNEVEPIRSTKQGSWTQQLGGSSERTKELRSVTPPGFADAFCRANPLPKG